MIATGGADGAVVLWSSGGERLWTRRHGGDLTSADFSRNGRLLVTSSTDGTARLWRVSDGRLLHVLKGHVGTVVQAAFSPDGRYIATAGEDSTARIWSTRTGNLVRRPLQGVTPGLAQGLTSLAFNPSGTLLATTAKSGDVRLWHVRGGKPLAQDLHFHTSVVSEAAFSRDGRWLVTAGPIREAVWRVSTGKRLLLLRGHLPGGITSTAFSPRGWRILTGGIDGTVRTYDCRLCARLPGLLALGRERLEHLKPPR
jgi:WD40 repeat protein